MDGIDLLLQGEAKPAATGLDVLLGASAPKVPEAAPAELSYLQKVKANMLGTGQAFNQAMLGGLRGAAGIGATLQHALNPAEWGNAQADKERRGSIDDFFATHTDPGSVAFKTGQTGAEVAGTAGVGGVLGAGAKVLGAAPSVVSALGSAGFTAGARAPGVVGALSNISTRAAAGAATGAGSAALVDPDLAGSGAVVGGVLPGAIGSVGAVGRGVGGMFRPTTPAATLVKAVGKDPAAVAAALRGAPTYVDGASPTVAQALQSPEASILQRVVADSPGGASLRQKIVQQNEARVAALEGVAPTEPTGAAMARENLGQSVARQVIPARQQAIADVGNLYNAVDPAGEVRLQLPLDEMQAAQDKFLGPGTFGQGKGTAQALDAARSVGSIQTDPLITSMKSPAATEVSLGPAVRRYGINPDELKGASGYAGEVRHLRESKFGFGMVNKNGKPLEQVAERMHADGYLDQPDVSELLQKLTDEASGSPVFSRYGDPARMARDVGMPDKRITPGTSNPIPVDWNTLQAFRSSVGDAANAADANGATKDAAALKAIKGSLDTRIDQAGAGQMLKPGESFPLDAYARWTDANSAHAARMGRFDNGPFAGMFRSSNPLEGGEIAAKAWGARPGLAGDVQAFKSLVNDNPAIMGQFKSMVTTEGAGTADAAGNLTTKFSKWVNNTLPGLKEAFSPEEVGVLRRIAQDVERAAVANKLGTSLGGSNTYQNASNALNLGLLDSPWLTKAAGAIPLVNSVAKPALEGVRNSARASRATQLSGLLSDSGQAASAIERLLLPQQPPVGLLGPAVLRALPSQADR